MATNLPTNRDLNDEMDILIAEDERITRRNLQRQLEQLGHDVTAVADGEEAWESYQDKPTPIIICDWEMPRMDGLELVRRLRAADTSGYVYIIMLTGKSAKQDLVAGMDAGADDFITKPFDRNELRVRLKAGERIITLERRLAEQNQLLSAANERMSRDLEAAAKVQQSLLPSTKVDSSLVHFAWRYLPCDELAGDFLNFFPLDEKHLAAFVVDVSGHGVASSLLSVTIGRLLTPQASSSSLLVHEDEASQSVRISSPAEVARELNRRFPMEEQNGLYFTMLYGVLNVETLVFQFVSAGHDPALHVPSNGDVRLIEGSDMPIGWIDDAQYEVRSVQLQAGDRLILYSDGVPEAMDEATNQFTISRMADAFGSSRSQSLDDSIETLMESLKSWTRNSALSDDVSLVGLEVVGRARD